MPLRTIGRPPRCRGVLTIHALLRLNTYSRLRELGLGEDYSIPASYTHYDHVLDTALSVGLVASEPTGTNFDVDEYFAVARGMEHQVPFVPELEDSTRFRARPSTCSHS